MSYTLGERIYEGKARVVHRAEVAASGRRVIVKQLRSQVAGAEDLRRIRHERDMLSGIDDPRVAQLLGYEERGLEAWLVIEDIGGESVARRTARGRLPLRDALAVAADVAGALGSLHARHVLHRDVGPNNVALAPSGRVQLFDFDLAARLPRGAAGLPPAAHVEGTLPYISPEQTGRVSLLVDERSDLYSLGAMLYELLVGRRPFESEDPLEIVHAHLALQPAPPREIDPSIPEVVSAITLRLLEKSPEDRYQSAFGLERDLRACLDSLDADAGIPWFPIGRHDVPARLHLRGHLHGREAETRQIVAAFEACRERGPSLVVVSGPPGIGKSTLVRALARHVAGSRGFLGVGKLEAGLPGAPHAALSEPLRALAQQIFAAGEGEVAAISERVAQAAAGAGAPLVDLVPEMAVVLGAPSQDRGAAPALSRDRARMLFTDLFGALARPERPVVLVLDDAQWADPASLDLLGTLAREVTIRGLCLVVTVRDEALAPGEPIFALLDALRRDGMGPQVISLSALDEGALAALLRDALALPPEDARSLASLLLRKTNGNPLSTEVFLSAIYRDDLLFFDAAAGRWSWDAAGIEARPVADNVVALLAERTAALGEGARRALGVAACLGGRFDAALVAAVGGVPETEAAAALDEATREGLLVPAEGAFRFAHDRVAEVVYGAVSEGDQRSFHAAACRVLRAAAPRPDDDAVVFDVLRHADAAGDSFGAEERLALARLGLAAGRRARASAAFEAAGAHLSRAIARVQPGAWTRSPELAYELYSAAFECAYAAGRYDEGDRLFTESDAHAPSAEARARAWAMRASGTNERDYGEVIVHVRTGCALVGVRLPERATVPVLLYELARTVRALRGRSADELAAAPKVASARVEAALDVLCAGLAAAQLTDPNMFGVMTMRGAALSAQHGSCSASASLYAFHAVATGAVLRDTERMKELGQLALRLSERFPDPVHACRAWLINGVFCQHHRDHVRTSLPVLQEAQRLGLLAGDNLVVGVAASLLATLSFSSGHSLDDVLACSDAQARLLVHLHGVEVREALGFSRQAFLALQGKTDALGSLATADFDPVARRLRADRHASGKTRVGVRFFAGLLHVIFDRPREALAELDQVHGEVGREWACLFQLGEYWFYRALALSALVAGGGLGRIEREKHLVGLRLAVRKLSGWAERSPRNFTHKHALAEAELRGLTGDTDAALRRYEEAIHGAQSGGFMQDAGVALERTGRFFLERGLVDIATTYLASARRAYVRWGAHGKVAWLDRQRPGLAGRDVPAHEGGETLSSGRTLSGGHPSSGSTSSDAGALDAPSIVKATQALSGERTMGRLLARMMEIVAESAGAQRGALLLVDGDPGAPRVAMHAEVAAGRPPVLLAQPRSLEEASTVPAGIVRWAARTGEPVLLADAASEGPFTQDPYVRAHRSRSILVMPLRWQDQVLGVLSLENDLVPGAFTEKRASLLATLCAQLAISLQNARYYAELERKVDERTRALREAQSRIVTLEKDATEAQMAGGFAHEMRNALAGARMLLGLAIGSSHLEGGGLFEQGSRRLREIYVGALPALDEDRQAALREDVRALNEVHRQLDDVVRRVEEALRRGLGITDDVLAYAALRREERGESSVPLLPLIEAIARDLAAPGVHFEIDVPADVAIPCKPEHLRSILENVARNACEAVAEAAPSGGGHVRIAARAAGRSLTLTIEDDGPGMAPDVQAHIFEPFFSTKPSSGIGLGLGVVRKLVSLYEGRIEVDSTPGRGTAFAITLPAGHLAPHAAS